VIDVLLVEDQPLLRAGFRLILDGEPGVRVVGEAQDGVEAISAARSLRPDVVLMDLHMPRIDGLAATRRIVAADPDARVLVLTVLEDEATLLQALQAGASGYLLKDASPDELVRALRAVASGDAVLDPAVTKRLLAAVRPLLPQPAERETQWPPSLSPREREILLRLAKGRSNREIATELVIGESTVKTHVAAVLTKLGLRDRIQAVIYAYEQGLVR
jgi:DNA-binding NarL/FixJ family response regulator